MRAHLVAILLMGGCTADATAQDWPTRPVTMVATAAAGSSNDVLGRILATQLSQVLGQQILVENVGGAGGSIGAVRVANAAPDGQQFLLGGVGTQALNHAIYKKPLYNARTDFTPVALLVEQSVVLVARRDLPVNDLRDFIAYAKVNHAKMQYGSPGAGNMVHLACAMLNARMGVDVTHIPYRGGGPAMQDLIAGRLDYQCVVASVAIPQIEGGKVKAIAILQRDRSPILPNLASAGEQGLAEFDVRVWNGFFLPKATAASIVQRLFEASVATLETRSVQDQLRANGATVVARERRSPGYLQGFVAAEIERWGAVVKSIGLSID